MNYANWKQRYWMQKQAAEPMGDSYISPQEQQRINEQFRRKPAVAAPAQAQHPGTNGTPQQWSAYARSAGIDPALAGRVKDQKTFDTASRYNPTIETPQYSGLDMAGDVLKGIPRGFVQGANNFGRMLQYPTQAAAYTWAPMLGMTGATMADIEQGNVPNPFSGRYWRNAWEGTKGAFGGISDAGREQREAWDTTDNWVKEQLPFKDPNSIVGAASEGLSRGLTETAAGFGLTKGAPAVSKALNPAEWGPVQRTLSRTGQAAANTLNTYWPRVGKPVVNGAQKLFAAQQAPIVANLRTAANKFLGREYSSNVADHLNQYATDGLQYAMEIMPGNYPVAAQQPVPLSTPAPVAAPYTRSMMNAQQETTPRYVTTTYKPLSATQRVNDAARSLRNPKQQTNTAGSKESSSI